MAERVFVDTNILVYFRDSTEPGKQAAAAAWMAYLWETGAGRISLQVLREYYVTVTAKLDPGLPPAQAREDVWSFRAWRPFQAGVDVLDEAWDIEDRFRLSFWDALIVASARRLECDVLLTEDLQDGQDLDGLTVWSPFSHSPG